MNVSNIIGIGEVYRVHAQISFIMELAEKYRLKRIFEYPIELNAFFVDKPWKQVEKPNIEGDLLLTWKAFPKIVKEMLEFKGNYFLLIGTNKYNFGAIIHQYYWKNPEIYLTMAELGEIVKFFGLEILESNYYDMPPWFDAPLSSHDTIHLSLKDSWIKKLLILEKLPLFKIIRSHHLYILAKRKPTN